MLELTLVLLLTAAGSVERIVAGKRHAEERRHLLALITAAAVSPAAAAVAARPPAVREPAAPKPVQAF